MSKLNQSFEELISNIEPSKEAVKFAQKAHEPIREHLEGQDYFVDSFLYGSYKRHTAIGDIKDVDIVLLTNFDPSPGGDKPGEVLKKLKSELGKYYKDPENQAYQRRSIRVENPLPDNKEVSMTLDIIPAVAKGTDKDPLWVPDREQNEWILSHPKEHIGYTTGLNREKNFVPLVKIMKWWWKYWCSVNQPKVERPKPKGFWLECLTAQCFDINITSWAESFVLVLNKIKEKYPLANGVPELGDPGLMGEVIKTSMSQSEYGIFLGAVEKSLELAVVACAESDVVESAKMWQGIFGDQFGTSSGNKRNRPSITTGQNSGQNDTNKSNSFTPHSPWCT